MKVRPAACPRRLRALALLVTLSAVALVGCIRAEIAIRVNDDGSGEVSVLAAFDEEAFSSFVADFGGSPESGTFPDASEIDTDALPPGATVQDYDEDGFKGARVTIPFAPGDDVASAIASATTGTTDETGLVGTDGAFERFELRREGDGWRFNATVAPVDTGATSGLDTSDFGGALFDTLFAEASFEIKVSLPGDVIEHNADRIEGDTLVWELGIGDAQSRDLMVLTGAGGSDSNLGVVIVVLVLAMAIGALAVWFVMRTRAASGGV